MFEITSMAIKEIKKKFGVHFCLFLLVSFLFFMSQIVVVNLTGPLMGRWIAEHKMKSDFSDWGFITLASDQEWNENVWQFRQELLHSGLVDGVGSFSLMGMRDDGLFELSEMQNASKVKENTMLDGKTLYAYFIDDISILGEEVLADEKLLEDYGGKEEILLLLGKRYQHIPLGTMYQSSLMQERKYVVAGYLPDDFAFFTEGIYHDDEVWNTGLVSDLDDMVIMVFQNHLQEAAQGLFYISDGVTANKMEEIYKLADIYHIKVSLMKLETLYERNNQSAIAESKYAAPYYMAILISAIVIIISYYLLDMIGNKKKYGIYYAVGFQNKDVGAVMLVESVITMLLSLMLSFFAFWRFFCFVYPSGCLETEAERFILGIALGSAFLTFVFLILFGVGVPWYILCRQTPKELITISEE